ncbi:MAG: hypothetical protein ACI934_000245 [Pseudohongiellaceae bacterium]|jgi:hypothetical protein|tara:strand:+ start:203 stop:628 length:426 start_codon:yes stop_codon:yes gene_type:complete
MLVSHRIDHDNKIIITTFAPEEASLKLFLEAFNTYQEELRFLPDYLEYNEMVDFRSITNINITASELKKLSTLTIAKDVRETVTKLALLVDSRPARTLAKVYEMIRNFNPSSKKQVKIFQDTDSALSWLLEDENILKQKPA